MPCDGSHMQPTVDEMRSQEIAKHICYVEKQLNQKTSVWILEASESIYGAPREIDTLTALLCQLLTELPESYSDSIIYDGKNPQARKLADWWDRHQRADLKRKATEQAEQDKQTAVRNLAEVLNGRLLKHEREALIQHHEEVVKLISLD